MSFLPDLAILLAYSLACVVLFITPGPDMSLFLAKTIAGGRSAGIAAFTGASLGCVVHSLLAAFGLSALIAASPAAFLALKIVGAAYLLWLAVDAVRNGSSLNVRTQEERRGALWPTFALGVTVNLTNPKVVLFFVTFLPQFVEARDPAASQKLFFLGAEFIVISIPLMIATVYFAQWIADAFRKTKWVERALNWGFAAVFTTFAAVILTAQGGTKG
jgi:threonine/homoserine/homoserine lactone efflux protein